MGFYGEGTENIYVITRETLYVGTLNRARRGFTVTERLAFLLCKSG